LVDPESNLTLGYEAVFLGTARVTRPGNPATVQIVNSKKEISRRQTHSGATAGHSPIRAPCALVQGQRSHHRFLRRASHEQRRTRFDISINRGRRHGLEPGNVLAIHRNVVIYDQQDYLKSRDRSTAIQLPPERYGLVYIFRTFNSVSYALVMESTNGSGRGHRSESLTTGGIFRGLPQMDDSGDLAAWIELSLVPGLGSSRFRSLLSAFGLPARVLGATRSQLCRVVPRRWRRASSRGIAVPKSKRRFAGPDSPARGADSRRHDVPQATLEIPDPPALLYVAGDPLLLASPALAVVGSRNATPQG